MRKYQLSTNYTLFLSAATILYVKALFCYSFLILPYNTKCCCCHNLSSQQRVVSTYQSIHKNTKYKNDIQHIHRPFQSTRANIENDVAYPNDNNFSSESLEKQNPTNKNQPPTRRDLLQTILKSVFSTSAALSLPIFHTLPSAFAVDIDENNIDIGSGSGMVSVSTVATLLRSIPTFTIVDEFGVPYMVVGEDAKVTGYFFIDYKEAQRILQLARKSADEAILRAKKEGDALEPDQLLNPWKQAKITSVPLDTAVSLVLKSNSKQVGYGNYYQIASSESDIEKALQITGTKELAEGKVPLFYYKDFTIPDKEINTNRYSPLFFNLPDLQRAYKKEYPGQPLPKGNNNQNDQQLQVTELLAVVTEMVKPDGVDEQLKSILFMPPSGSTKAVKELYSNTNKKSDSSLPTTPSFVLGKRNIIL